MSESYAIQMPSNYVLMNEDEMEYLDGGLYMSYGTLVGIVSTIGANPYAVSSIANCARWSAAFLCCKLGSVLGPVGWAVGGAICAWFVSQAWTFAERSFCALVKRRGVNWTIGWKWGVVPELNGDLR